MKLGWIALMVSVLTDVISTLLSKQISSGRQVGLIAAVFLLYLGAVTAFTFSLRLLPMGPAFAIWSGLTLTFIALLAVPIYGQAIDLAGGIGMGLIITGTVVLALFSRMQTH